MSFRPASNSPVLFVGEKMPFLQLGDLHFCGHFGVVEILTVPLLLRSSDIDTFITEAFPMERRIVPVRSHPVAIFSEYLP